MNGSIFQNFPKCETKKSFENLVILFKIWCKIGPIGILNDHFFLKNWYLYVSAVQFRCGTSLPKPNLSAP